MEIVTLDILAAVINSLRYADPRGLNRLKKITVLSYLIAESIDEELCYKTFMASLLKEMSGIGILSETPEDKKYRPYKSAEMIRTMPEIIPFQYRIADIVLENRERMNGSGYPAGKEKIYPEAKIIGLAEDYIDTLSMEDIINSDKYDPVIVGGLLEVVKIRQIKQILEEDDLLENFINRMLEKYNVYKNELDEFEREHFLETIASFIDNKHKYTAGHSKRVATYSYVIAKVMGYEGEKLMELRYAAYLHDIGKLATKIDLLDKTGKLTDEEYEEIKAHARYSYEIMDNSMYMKRFTFGALHHERIDGRGYPFGLKGNEIPEGAKIIAIADVLDALTSDRPYRKPFTFEEAFDLMEMMVGTSFDREIFDSAKEGFL